jgi:hypothetical protein
VNYHTDCPAHLRELTNKDWVDEPSPRIYPVG